MKNRLSRLIAGFMLIMGIGLTLAPALPVGAVTNVDPLKAVCTTGNTNSAVCQDKNADIGETMKIVINILLFIVGALAVVMIIVSGILYATSTGDSTRITAAKNTLMYSIVGLVVAFLAFAIVNWVIGRF